MKPATERQIRNGVRIGGSLGLFLIAGTLLSIGVDGLQAADSNHLQLWPDAAIAASLITAALVIMVLTARVWILYIAGCLLFAIPKCLVVLLSGRNFYAPHEPFSRLEAAEIVLFSVASLFLIYRITRSHTPNVTDRMAFTVFVICFVFGLSRQNLAVIGLWQALGLAALIVAWFSVRSKHGRRHSAAVRSLE